MRIILDECVPNVIRRELPGLSISTVQKMGWSGVKNGELLKKVSAEFDVFITSDKNLRHQQNLAEMKMAIIVLPTNQVPVVRILVDAIERAIDTIRPGEIVEIPLPNSIYD